MLPCRCPWSSPGSSSARAPPLLLLVAAEMIAVESGIGFLVLNAANLMATTKLMVGIVAAVAAGRPVPLGLRWRWSGWSSPGASGECRRDGGGRCDG